MKKLYWILIAFVTAITLVAEFLGEHYYAWERVPAFYALFGFFGCLLLIFAAKGLGGLLLLKKEDYYDAD